MDKHKPRIKFRSQEYLIHYDDLSRFSSYYYQILWMIRLGPKTVLDIGIGNRTVSDYLKKQNIKVTTFDYDKRLNPDIIGDVRSLPKNIGEYDAVMCCQVLEHLPYDDFELALSQMKNATKKHIILSLPYAAFKFELVLRCQWILRRLAIRIPAFFLKTPKTGEHYWEIGRSGYPISKIRRSIKRAGLKIIHEGSPTLNLYHHFFILEK